MIVFIDLFVSIRYSSKLTYPLQCDESSSMIALRLGLFDTHIGKTKQEFRQSYGKIVFGRVYGRKRAFCIKADFYSCVF